MATQAEAAISPRLIWTKLHAPVARELVPRRELLAFLSTATPHPITLVRAPAGWGKSTLLAQWHAAEEESRRFAWLALDRGDNDPVVFWTYLIEAVRTVDPAVGEEALPLLRAPGTDLVADVLPAFVNELASVPQQIVLVLDDYHLIRNAAIDEGLAFLVERLPQTVELVLSTRTEPALPLARLRARGELAEIDAQRLRFTDDEAHALLNDLHELGLRRRDVLQLLERTEGWAAGLYLATLSLQGAADPERFIEAFAGDDRLVVDYLSTEVLAGQPDDVREFLLRTSVLERLCAPLCDAVAKITGSARILEEIERSNFFLLPLDTKREWYRYHHLFGELLRHELELATPELVPFLHRRAALWCREADLVPEAIHHATTAGDVADASELIAAHWLGFRDQHQLETVLSWLDRLPEEAVRADARLGLVQASTLLEVGRVGEVGPWLDAAELAASGNGELAGSGSVEIGVAAYRAIIQYVLGDVGGIRETARPALELEEGGSGYWRSALLTIFGASVFLAGRSRDAVAPLAEALALSEQSGHALAQTHALGWSAAVHADLGEWDRVDAVLEQGDALLRARPDLREYFGTAMSHVIRGKRLAGEVRLAEADAAMTRATELARRGVSRLQLAYGLLAAAELKGVLGDRVAAQDLLLQARREIAACPDPGQLPQLAAQVETGLGVAKRSPGKTSAAVALSERELAVLRLLGSELSKREIGRELYVSLNTVKTHTKSIFRKLDVSTRADAVARGRELGLL